MKIENWPDVKVLSYVRYIYCNLIQCVERFPTGSKKSKKMSKTEAICKGSF